MIQMVLYYTNENNFFHQIENTLVKMKSAKCTVKFLMITERKTASVEPIG